MASYTHRVPGATEITIALVFYKLDIQINTRKDMWWKEACYRRFIITFLTIIICFTSFSQHKFWFSVEKKNSKFHWIYQLPGQS